MKAIAFAQRLLRDTKEKDLAGMAADRKLELLDAINASIQKLHALAPSHSKITVGSIYLASPTTVSIGVTEGSTAFTGYTATTDDLCCTIRVDGDGVDNQVVSSGVLLHPYAGSTGTVSATIYHDGAILPEPYSEIVTKPKILETRRDITLNRTRCQWHERQVAEPRFFWVENNGRNNNPVAPAVFRVDSLPGSAYRLEFDVLLAPARIAFLDILESATEIPMRDEHVEAYLLPIARGLLTTSEMWRDAESKASTVAAAESAESGYSIFSSQTLATPKNRVGTPLGY